MCCIKGEWPLGCIKRERPFYCEQEVQFLLTLPLSVTFQDRKHYFQGFPVFRIGITRGAGFVNWDGKSHTMSDTHLTVLWIQSALVTICTPRACARPTRQLCRVQRTAVLTFERHNFINFLRSLTI